MLNCERPTARVILINDVGEVLMVKFENEAPADPNRPDLIAYWVLPGGGVEDGESYVEAARREVSEETGFDVQIGPWVWTRELQLTLSGRKRLVKERYFVAVCSGRRVDTSGHADDGIKSCRWWKLDEMRHTQEVILPHGLPELLEPVLRNELPSTPIEIGGEL